MEYDTKAWAGETTLGRRVFNHRFRMLGREFSGWQLLKRVPMHEDRSMSEVTYLWQNEAAPRQQLIRVNVREVGSWRDAQKQLLGVLHENMRSDLPRGTGRLAELGDVQFVARALPSDIPAAVRFTRGNIAVSVDSAGPTILDVSEIALGIDRLLREAPTKVPALRRLAQVKTPKIALIKGKEGVALVKDLAKSGDQWLKVLVPDGELRRKGQSVVYTAPPPARKAVQVFVIRSPARPAGAQT
jgi:hypothetical protein